jgi:pSer/pThr/pTyr-binding forkhead associated (FHA) protein
MNSLEPVSVALKFGFLAVLYVFLLWVVRSARRDLRSSSGPDRQQDARALPADATGLYAASAVGGAQIAERAPRLVVERAPGHDTGMIYDLDSQLVLGRGDHAEIRIEDPFASSRHARIYEQGNAVVIEDLGSTNGTYLNEELLESPRPLHPGDHVRIGESEFSFEVD